MTIETKRTTIRRIEESDYASVKAIWEDFNASAYAKYDKPHDTGDDAVRARVAKWAAADGTDHLFFAVCVGERLIGYVAFHKRETSHEMGYCFHSAYHGQGYAKESITALFAYLRGLGIVKITAGTALENGPSVALLTSLRFRQTGTENVSFYKDADGNDVTFIGGLFELSLDV